MFFNITEFFTLSFTVNSYTVVKVKKKKSKNENEKYKYIENYKHKFCYTL